MRPKELQTSSSQVLARFQDESSRCARLTRIKCLHCFAIPIAELSSTTLHYIPSETQSAHSPDTVTTILDHAQQENNGQ